MTIKRGNPDQHLQLVGGTYYARVRVPRTLEKLVGQSHIRRSLKTGSKAEANQRKYKVVAELKDSLEKLRGKPAQVEEKGYTLADARAIREELERLRESPIAEDAEKASTLEDVVSDMAEKVESLHGTPRAIKWHRAATATDSTLRELLEKWLAGADVVNSTKAGHTRALTDLLEFLDDDEARPQDVSQKTAIKFVDAMAAEQKLKHTTQRDRLISLAGFWGWMRRRGHINAGPNPWEDHDISKTQNPGSRPEKRKGGFTADELGRLLQGTPKTRSWPTWDYLPDLMVLGMFTGSRIEKLCDLTAGRVTVHGEGYILNIQGDKTDAGDRLVGVVHPAPVAALKRRLEGRQSDDSLFPELTRGGIDDKMSASASKAFGRYRRACDVPDGTDFHSYRRVVIDVLDKGRKAKPVEIARFVGHKVGNMAADVYAGQSLTPEATLEVAGWVRYPAEVEDAAVALMEANRPAPQASKRTPRPRKAAPGGAL